jgi:hypothetical protein
MHNIWGKLAFELGMHKPFKQCSNVECQNFVLTFSELMKKYKHFSAKFNLVHELSSQHQVSRSERSIVHNAQNIFGEKEKPIPTIKLKWTLLTQ